MSTRDTTFYDAHPFDWTDGFSRGELEATLAPLLASFIREIPPDARVLDMGCGPGRVMSCLAASGLPAVGLDLSLESVRLMKERTRRPGVVGNGLKLPIAEGAMDRVIADGVIHHTPDPFQAFAEGCRAVKPGGLFYVAVYKPGGYYEKLYKFPGATIRALMRYQAGRVLVCLTFLPLYFLAHSIKSRGRRSWAAARNLFYDYFVTPIAEFISRDDVARWCKKCGVEIVDYQPNPGLNVHSFVIQKPYETERREEIDDLDQSMSRPRSSSTLTLYDPVVSRSRLGEGTLLLSRTLVVLGLALFVYSAVWNYSTRRYLKGFSDAILPLAGSPEQKTEALVAWFHKEPDRDDPETTRDGLLANRDPVYIVKDMRLLKICGSASNAFMNLADVAGLRVRRLLLLDEFGGTKHVVIEVLWGDRWIVVDPQHGYLYRDSSGRALTRNELRDPVVFNDAISRMPGYSPRYTFENTIHIRLAKIPILGNLLRKALDRFLPGWEESINWAFLPENPSLWLLFVSCPMLLIGILANFMVKMSVQHIHRQNSMES